MKTKAQAKQELSEQKRTGGNAFPYHHPTTLYGSENEKGITTRDWFAGRALPALIVMLYAPDQRDSNRRKCVELAYEFADDALKVREQ